MIFELKNLFTVGKEREERFFTLLNKTNITTLQINKITKPDEMQNEVVSYTKWKEDFENWIHDYYTKLTAHLLWKWRYDF